MVYMKTISSVISGKWRWFKGKVHSRTTKCSGKQTIRRMESKK